MLSFCMVAAQGVMLPIAILVGRNADGWGRRPIFLIAFAVLPIRAALYTLSDNAFWLLGVQLLDGVGAGIYRSADAPRDRRHHARHGALQSGAGRGRDHAGRRRVDQRARGWRGDRTISAIRHRFSFSPPPPRSPSSSFSLSCRRRATSEAMALAREEAVACGSARRMTPTAVAALAILALTYVGVAAGRIPGLRLDRAGIAFLGGAAMIALGPLSLEEAFRAIDFDTIALLLGMMIVVAHLKVSGAFRALGALAIEHAHAPFVLLVTVTALAGIFSAFLVNDAICLVMTPIVMQVVRALGRNPLPYLVATATASNCGSVATITGNPQNMVIGALSRIPYPAFAAALAPVAVFGLVAVVVVVWLVYRTGIRGRRRLRARILSRGRMHAGQVVKASLVCAALAVAFFAGAPPAEAALLGGAILLFTRADQAPSDLSRDSTGRSSSCSRASSSWSPARRRRC